MNFEQEYALSAAVDQGVWRTLKGGLKVKVASLRSPAYKTALNRYQKIYASEMRANDITMTVMITARAMSETILLDWEGAEDLDGNPIPYTPEVGAQMLEKYELFREEVALVSAEDDNYKEGLLEKL